LGKHEVRRSWGGTHSRSKEIKTLSFLAENKEGEAQGGSPERQGERRKRNLVEIRFSFETLLFGRWEKFEKEPVRETGVEYVRERKEPTAAEGPRTPWAPKKCFSPKPSTGSSEGLEKSLPASGLPVSTRGSKGETRSH